MEYLAIVRLHSSKTCFVDFSQPLLKLWKNEIEQAHDLLNRTQISVPLCVKCPSGEFVTSWSGKAPSAASDDELIIYIDRVFACQYNIEDGSSVQIYFISEHLHPAKQVTLCPCRKSDWEILELNSFHIENVLLDHVSLVKVGQVFPLHLSPSTVVLLKTLSTSPQNVVLLQEFTEVIVAPFESQQQQINEGNLIKHVENMEKYTNQVFTYLFKPAPQKRSDSFAISRIVKCINELLVGHEDGKDEKVTSRFDGVGKTVSKWEVEIQPLPEYICTSSISTSDVVEKIAPGNDGFSLSIASIDISGKTDCPESDLDVDEHSVSFEMKSKFPPFQGFVCKTLLTKCMLNQVEDHPYFEVEFTNAMTNSSVTDTDETVPDVDNQPISPESEKEKEKILLQVKILPSDIWKTYFNSALMNTMFVSPSVLIQMQVKGSCKANICRYEGPIDEILGIVLHVLPFQELTDAVKKHIEINFRSYVKSWIDMGESAIINQGTLFTFHVNGDRKHAVGEIIGVGNKLCGRITQSNLNDIFIHVEADETEDICVRDLVKKDYYDFKDIATDIIKHFELGFTVTKHKKARTSFLQNHPVLLLYGKSATMSNGCGKTLVSYYVADHFSSSPYFCHVEYIKCVTLRGKQVNAILKCWETVFQNAFSKEPAIILFDDLDQLISRVDLLQEGFTKDTYSQRLGDLFCSLIRNIQNANKKVFIIVTSTSLESLHSSLLPEGNSHLFTKYFSISSVTVDQSELLKWYINHGDDGNDLNVKTDLTTIKMLSQKLTNYNIKNISSLAKRTLQAKFGDLFCENVETIDANIGSTNSENVSLKIGDSVCSDDIESNIKTFDQIMMHNLNTHKPKAIHWEDIGGLNVVKETLKETLLWPAMYSELLSFCPLRLCSGVLLYGAPGTAKTMLATAVSFESNLNFICVKGPELLSKYIGSSEGNVRDLFARAEAAKPCIVFFDELESIAPRRGHDNTGVTDRVVNQLLTQLDGVESLDGVFVLAATSRPDLIDPALLRPGRFDKSIHCPMPTEEERKEILDILVKDIPVDADVDIEKLSISTPGFSGADLKALVFNAQVESAHEFLDEIKDNEDNADFQSKEYVDVRMVHFNKALETTKPSVSSSEKKKYERVFSNFKSQGDVSGSARRNQKVTLA